MRSENLAGQDEDGVIIRLVVLRKTRAAERCRSVFFVAYVGLGRRALRERRGGRNERGGGRAVKFATLYRVAVLGFDDYKRAANATTLSSWSSSSSSSSSLLVPLLTSRGMG